MTGKFNVHLGTLDEKCHANIHPAWYYYDPVIYRKYVKPLKQAKKTYNLPMNGNI